MADRQRESSTEKEQAQTQRVESALDDTEAEEVVGDQEYEASFGEDECGAKTKII